MDWTAGDLKDLVLECSGQEFNTEHLFSDDPWYFTRQGATCTYDAFREKISTVFGINADNVKLVGSGYFGRSLSPDRDKMLKKYRFKASGGLLKSDLDVVIVSEKYFELIWTDFLEAYYSGQYHIFKKYARNTFKRFVCFDGDIDRGSATKSTKFERVLKIYDQVTRQTSRSLRLQNDIKFRVYRSMEDVLAYHNWSFLEFKRAVSP